MSHSQLFHDRTAASRLTAVAPVSPGFTIERAINCAWSPFSDDLNELGLECAKSRGLRERFKTGHSCGSTPILTATDPTCASPLRINWSSIGESKTIVPVKTNSKAIFGLPPFHKVFLEETRKREDVERKVEMLMGHQCSD